jgi:hypothetical protein
MFILCFLDLFLSILFPLGFRVILFLDALVCLVNCFFPLLQLYLFSELVQGLVSVLVKAVEPRVSGSAFTMEDKETFLVDVSHFLFFFHIEGLHAVAEILNLFFNVCLNALFAVAFESSLEVFLESLILLLLLLIVASLFVVFPEKPCFGGVLVRSLHLL